MRENENGRMGEGESERRKSITSNWISYIPAISAADLKIRHRPENGGGPVY